MKWHTFFLSILLLLLFQLPVHAENELQKLIDEAEENDVLTLQDKTYEGNIVIHKPMTIKGTNNTVIKGEGNGNVIEVKASNVSIENVTVNNTGYDRNAGEEYAAIKIFEDNNIVKDVTITDSFHGIYLSQAHGNEITNIHVTGQQNGEIAGQGNGLHLYYSNDNILTDNVVIGTRDGIFFDYSNGNNIKNNDISRTRYGLHFMYSNENEFTENRFTYNTAGAAIMFSYENELKGNEFSLNQGSRSFGLLLQGSDENIITNNMFFQNLRGIYIDQSQDNQFKSNQFIQNQIGVELWGSSSTQVFSENTFDRNVATVLTLGGHGDNSWNENGRGNFWGSNVPLLDLDQNEIGDDPVQYSSSLYKLVEENELAYLFLKSPAIKIYEKMNEVLNEDQVMFTDEYPLIAQHDNDDSRNQINTATIPVMGGSLVLILFAIAKAKRRRGK